MNNLNHKPVVYKQSTSFICPWCQRTFSLESNLKRHIFGVHVKSNLKCSHCDKSFTRTDNLKRHIHGVHYEIGFVCEFCDFIATRMDSLKRHNEEKHRNKSKGELSRKTIRCTLLNRTKDNINQ